MRFGMKSPTLKNQRGAVLAFSLVMLLLLTLVSVSMIRQNKTQISIATNAAQQVTAMASVDTALRQTQAALEALRYVDSNTDTVIDATERAAHHCKSGATDSIHPVPHATGTLTGLSPGVTATIQAEYCISNYQVSAGTGNEYRCLYSYIDNATGNAMDTANTNNWVRNVLVGSLCPYNTNLLMSDHLCRPPSPAPDPPLPDIPSADNVSACNKLNAAGSLTPGMTWSSTSRNVNACPIEVYTVHVSLVDANGSQRTVESKFEIDCSNDLNP